MSAKITLLASYAEQCRFIDGRRMNVGADNKPKFSLRHDVAYDESDHKRFDGIFTLEIAQPNFILEMTYRSEFKAETDINDEFKAGHFPNVNAPAIAYPLLRAAVASACITLFGRPIVLPVVNFQEVVIQNAAKAEEAKKPE